MAQSVHLVGADGITPVTGGASTIADGADVQAGATVDAAVAAGAAGTAAAKLRRISADLATAMGSLGSLVTLQGAGLPAALATGGGVKVAPLGSDGAALFPAAVANSDSLGNFTATQVIAALSFWNSGSSVQRRVGSMAQLDTLGVGALPAIGTYLFNGATADRSRTPNTFKTAVATSSGDTALWTPASSKKFRLMACAVYVTQDAALASGADLAILLRDATTALGIGFSVFVPAIAGTVLGAGWFSGWLVLGNGPLSALANNALNVNLSVALTSGTVRAIAVGTEE